MRAGRLDRLIDLQRRSFIEDAEFKDEIETFSTYDTNVAAERMDRSGNENYFEGVNIPTRVTIYRIRYRDDVQELDRIVEDDKVYDIDYIKELGRREGLELTCRMIV